MKKEGDTVLILERENNNNKNICLIRDIHMRTLQHSRSRFWSWHRPCCIRLGPSRRQIFELAGVWVVLCCAPRKVLARINWRTSLCYRTRWSTKVLGINFAENTQNIPSDRDRGPGYSLGAGKTVFSLNHQIRLPIVSSASNTSNPLNHLSGNPHTSRYWG